MAAIHLGFELGTAQPVSIPLAHMVVSGLTQFSGKTTTIEALVQRASNGVVTGPGQDARVSALGFVTKRGEIGFSEGRAIHPYYRDSMMSEGGGWQYVASVLEGTFREKMRMQRSFIMNVSAGAKSLKDVLRNVYRALEGDRPKGIRPAAGFALGMYTELKHYLAIVVPQIDRAGFSSELPLMPGLNMMNLTAYSLEMQALVIRSSIEWVLEREKDVIIVLPEAWQFLPLGRSGPVKQAAETFIRQGAVLRDYLWIDSQDIASIDSAIRKSIGVWILGRQPEINEAQRTIDHLPMPKGLRPKAEDVQQLGRGQFYVCTEDGVRKVYVQPAWMPFTDAQEIAAGSRTIDSRRPPHLEHPIVHNVRGPGMDWPLSSVMEIIPTEEEDPSMCKEHERLRGLLDAAERRAVGLENDLQRVREELGDEKDRATDARERDLESMAAVASLRSSLITLLGPMDAAPAPLVHVEEVVEAVLKRIPVSTHGGAVTVLAPEALRLAFQKDEVDRLLKEIAEMQRMDRRVLKFLVAIEAKKTQKEIAERLGIGSGGSSMQNLRDAVTRLVAAGYLETPSAHGVGERLRAKITEDLKAYKADEVTVEQVYANAVHHLSTAA